MRNRGVYIFPRWGFHFFTKPPNSKSESHPYNFCIINYAIEKTIIAQAFTSKHWRFKHRFYPITLRAVRNIYLTLKG